MPNISKVFEKVINKNILQFCEINKVIPDNQFGFRKDHFTYHAMIKLASDISLAMNGNYVIGAILIDLKSAFDSVWLNGLLYKLDTLNFPVYLQKIVWMLLKNRKCYVESTFNKEIYTSKMYNLQNGLQQGTINAPILFSIYISDILFEDMNMLAFADDIISYSKSNSISLLNSKLKHKMQALVEYCKKWSVLINFEKCESILFRVNSE